MAETKTEGAVALARKERLLCHAASYFIGGGVGSGGV